MLHDVDNMHRSKGSKLDWLGTPWTFFVPAILTWPIYIGVLRLCLRARLSPWVANAAGVILIFGGFFLCAATALAAWRRPARQRLLICFCAFATWGLVGRLLHVWFGDLVREVAR